MLDREAGVTLRRPVLQDPDVDEGLVEALAGDAGVVPHVEVAVGVLERRRHRLDGVRRENGELGIGGVGTSGAEEPSCETAARTKDL